MTVPRPEAPNQSGVPTTSRVLDDGRLVELLLDPRTERTRFACGRGESIELVDVVRLPTERELVPISARNNLIRHRVVLLPEEPEQFQSVAALTKEIEDHIARYVDLSPDFLRIASAYVLLSWVYDCFNELPYLRFRGDYGSGKTRALLIVGALMYSPLFASGASTISPIFHALDLFRGTLVIDESDFRMSDEKAELVKIFNNGNVRGFPVLRSQATPQGTYNPRAFHVFGPKLVAMRKSFDDRALESRFITEEMGTRPLRTDIPINLPDVHEGEARSLRNKLLSYRFRMHGQVAIDSSCYDPRLSPRANQVIAPLLAVVGDAELRRAIQERMRTTETWVEAERSASPEGELLDVVLTLARADTRGFLPIGEITTAFVDEHGHEYDRPITARYVGHLLRTRLRLRTWKRHGNFVVGTADADELTLLAKRYGVHGDEGTSPAP